MGHRLEALRMRLHAEADAGTAAAAAMTIAGERSATRPPDVVEVALQIAQAQQGAAEEGLADVLRSVRQELE